jgi:hypothetical protein
MMPDNQQTENNRRVIRWTVYFLMFLFVFAGGILSKEENKKALLISSGLIEGRFKVEKKGVYVLTDYKCPADRYSLKVSEINGPGWYSERNPSIPEIMIVERYECFSGGKLYRVEIGFTYVIYIFKNSTIAKEEFTKKRQLLSESPVERAYIGEDGFSILHYGEGVAEYYIFSLDNNAVISVGSQGYETANKMASLILNKMHRIEGYS